MLDKQLLSTTEVAKLLAVTPDTVLKWVKASKIHSYRTPGGHSRIPREEVTRLLAQQSNGAPSEELKRPKARQYCWEYLANGGEVKEECIDCITYRSRARRCYELRDLPGDMGCLRMLCETSCEGCDYYKLMIGKKQSILVVSESKRVIRNRSRIQENQYFNIRFVDNEYECSRMIEKFRPDFIIINASFGKKRATTFCNYLFNDPRIPVTRIVLTSKTKDIVEYCEKEIFGWIQKPFSLEDLKKYIDGVSSAENEKKLPDLTPKTD